MKKNIKSQIKDPELIRTRHLQIGLKAGSLFVKKGFKDTSMREISHATGISIGNLYDYISRKEDVLCLVFDAFYSTWTENLSRHGVFAIEDPVEQLRAAVRTMLELVHDFRDMALLMYRESTHLPREFLVTTLQKETEFIECFEKILRRGMKEKAFRITDPFLAASMIVYQLSFEALRGWGLKRRYGERELREKIEDMIMRSVV